MNQPTIQNELETVIKEFEEAATELSKMLERFDLSAFQQDETPIHLKSLSIKIKVAKGLLKILKKGNEETTQTKLYNMVASLPREAVVEGDKQ